MKTVCRENSCTGCMACIGKCTKTLYLLRIVWWHIMQLLMKIGALTVECVRSMPKQSNS